MARVFDEAGRFAPTYFDDRLSTREADVVIMAIGQKADLKFITAADGINLTPRGLIEADPDTLATSRAGVFAGGRRGDRPLDRHRGGGRGAGSRHFHRPVS